MKPMTIDALRQTCPAIFATHPANGVSPKYTFISTEQILTTVSELGWYPIEARVQRAQSAETAKHFIRFRHQEQMDIGPDKVEMVLINSHNRTSRFCMYGGIFRSICSNGLIVMSTKVGGMKMLHINQDQAAVQKTAKAIGESTGELAALVDRFKAKELNADQAVDYAAKVLKVRYASYTPTISPAALLKARRPEDEEMNTWVVMNRIQENMIKGGVTDGKHTTKPITSVIEDIRLNQKIWELGEQYLN
jgi:Domain of unknown function (DUF932)